MGWFGARGSKAGGGKAAAADGNSNAAAPPAAARRGTTTSNGGTSAAAAPSHQHPPHQQHGGQSRSTFTRQHSGSQYHLQQHKKQPVWRRALDKLKPATKSSVHISFEMLLLCAVVYGVLVFAAGKAFLPGGPAFATLVIWICSVVAAEIAAWLRIPRVVGMLGSGLLLANVPGGVVAAFPPKWGVQMRAAALATIFLRCGLELEFKTMALYKWPALRLAFLPGICEALFDAGLAVALFGMPFTLALSLGFILKAVGPGLVVPAMFQLQKAGWGAAKGIPSTVVIAASFDDIIAITGFSIFINIAIATGANAAWQIASGPLQVIFGMVGGVLAGVVLGATRIFDNRHKRLIGIYGSALLVMFFLEYYDMLSGGALGSLTVGMVTCLMWEHGRPARASLGPNQDYSADVERVMAVVWNWVMEPMLFATIGTSIVFSRLPASTIPRSLAIVVTGLCVRVLVTFFIMGSRRYTWRERTFFAVAWTPKATVQASLSAVPLTLIQQTMEGAPDYEQWVTWGKDLLATGIFAIIVCASLGTAAVYWFAPVLLDREEPQEDPRTSRVSREASRRTLQASQPASSGESHVDAATVLQELRGADDHAMINNYFDAIEDLVALVREGRAEQAKEEGLCETVLDLQEAIARDVGPRQLTVRQMLHSAALRSRQPTITAAAADQLVRVPLSDLDESTVNCITESIKSSPPGSLVGASPRVNRISSSSNYQLGGAPASDVEAGQHFQQQQQQPQQHGWPLESIGSNVAASFPAILTAPGPGAPSPLRVAGPRPGAQQQQQQQQDAAAQQPRSSAADAKD